MEHGVGGLRSDEEDFETLRARVIECICENVLILFTYTLNQSNNKGKEEV
jgi:hypothetical protein